MLCTGFSMDKTTVKVCFRCKQEKQFSDFNKDTVRADGLCHMCKICQRAYRSEWRLTCKDRIKEYQQNSRRKSKTRFVAARQAAKVRKMVFELTFDQYSRIMADNRCTYCGCPVSIIGHGLDRIDSAKGYILGNVTPCCGVCNFAKSDLTQPEFAGLISRICMNWLPQVLTNQEVDELCRVLFRKRYVEDIDGIGGLPEVPLYGYRTNGAKSPVFPFLGGNEDCGFLERKITKTLPSK